MIHDAKTEGTVAVAVLPDAMLLELIHYVETKINHSEADFEEFDAYIVCRQEYKQRTDRPSVQHTATGQTASFATTC